MYQIPHDFEITTLRNEVISHIAFGLNVITIFFHKGLLIQFSGPFSIHYEGKTFSFEEVCPVSNDFGLLQLLEKKIIDVSINEARTTLSLTFETEVIVSLLSDEWYESFEIHINERRIII